MGLVNLKFGEYKVKIGIVMILKNRVKLFVVSEVSREWEWFLKRCFFLNRGSMGFYCGRLFVFKCG